MTDPVIEVRDLTKKYGDFTAIDQLSLTVEEGEIFGLLGPNGSGKTTLTHCLLALLSYESGEIRLFGQPMSPQASQIKQAIGFVPQDVAVYEQLTVYENIDYFCSLYIADGAERKAKVEEAIRFVQLDDFRKFKPKQLSGGLLRRLNLACGIAHKPKLIFMDEPTVAVDPQSRNKILEGIKTLNQEGATVVYTTHYMEEVERLCDRLAILDHGKTIAEGTIPEIMSLSSLGETLKIQQYDLPDSLLDLLRDDPEVYSLSYDNGLLTLKMKAGESKLAQVLHLMEAMGVEVQSVSAQQPNLNDVFLEITGKELRDHA